MGSPTQVVQRYLSQQRVGGRLSIMRGKVDPKNTEILQKVKLKARNPGDFQSAVLSAGFYAQKLAKTMYGYAGNSYMHMVWRVTYNPSEYLNPISNTGKRLFSVTPDLIFTWHEVE